MTVIMTDACYTIIADEDIEATLGYVPNMETVKLTSGNLTIEYEANTFSDRIIYGISVFRLKEVNL